MQSIPPLRQKAIDILNRFSGKELSIKEKLAIPQQEMPCQEAHERRYNMQEVALGYFAEQAVVEAKRCLQCHNAPCIKGCPVSINIPAFIRAIEGNQPLEAFRIIKQTNMLPAVCGRVCPQEKQCMAACTVGKSLNNIEKAVAIGRLERYAADYASRSYQCNTAEQLPQNDRRIAIVGSGPSALSAAADLARAGCQVEIFEALQQPGGVTLYGIPEFRLPKEIVRHEIEQLKALGVVFHTDYLVGRTRSIDNFLKDDGFNAVYIASGAGLPVFMNIPGENLKGVLSANEYLTRINLMQAYLPQSNTPINRARKVAVLGGGNVAMDAARTALRLDAEEVYIVYRRSAEEMPARLEEIHHAEEEGVIFSYLTQPVELIGDSDGHVRGLKCLRCRLGGKDESGRLRPEVIKNSEFVIPVDLVIIAIGNSSNPLIRMTTPGLLCNERGNIITDEDGKTSLDSIYAGGDSVSGAATVISAMGQGRRAAAAINRTLNSI
jgi:glutamate synthase (NADPH/NADH) small chain